MKSDIKSFIYLDSNATTSLAPEIAEKIGKVLPAWGNPSSIHWAGQNAKTFLREARASVAGALHVSPLEIIFTSGGSESNATVLQSFFKKIKNSERNEFITSKIEHPSVLKTLQYLKSQGAIVHEIAVSRDGQFDWAHFEKVLSTKTVLVSVMLANNETGLLLPIKKITEKAHSVGAKVHTDAVQALGKISIDLTELGVDYASFSAHKFYAFKGCGVLYSKKGNDVEPLILGGGQERQRRGGTENTLGIWALGLMTGRAQEIPVQGERLRQLRDQMEKRILKEISGVVINHAKAPRLPNTSSMVLSGVDGETLLMSLDVKGFAVSTGAACSSGNPEPSPVLLALGLSREEAQSSLRISFGWQTAEEQVEQFVEVLKSVVTRLRSLNTAQAEVSL